MDYKYELEITSQLDEVSHTTFTKKAWVLNGEKIVSAGWACFKEPLQSILIKNRREIFVSSNYFGDKSFLNVVEKDKILPDRVIRSSSTKQFIIIRLHSNNPKIISRAKLLI